MSKDKVKQSMATDPALPKAVKESYIQKEQKYSRLCCQKKE